MVDSKYLARFIMNDSDYQCELGMSPKKQQPRKQEAPLPLLESREESDPQRFYHGVDPYFPLLNKIALIFSLQFFQIPHNIIFKA